MARRRSIRVPRGQTGQSFTEILLVIVSVALTAMLGFSVMNAGIGSQSASMAEALAGGTPRPEVQFEAAIKSSGLALVDFDRIAAAPPVPVDSSDESGSVAFGQGFVSGLIDNLWEELSALLSPIDTALALTELGRLLATETVATLQLLYDELIASQIDKFVNGNDYERGFVVGNQVSALKAVSVLAKASGAAVLVGIAKRADDADGIPRINGKRPRNYQYAGQTHPSGVRFNDQGFPDFSPYATAKVEINGLRGRYRADAKKANAAAGLKKTPKGYVWHHVEDGRTMQLIPKEIHNAVAHTGGAAIIRERLRNGAGS